MHPSTARSGRLPSRRARGDAVRAHPDRRGPAGLWLFVGSGANPPHQDVVRGWWIRTLRAAGVTGIQLHDLRHFYASALIAAGCDVVTVQRALGHGSATTTLDTYSHLWPTAEDRTRNAAAAVMRTVLADSADSVRTLPSG